MTRGRRSRTRRRRGSTYLLVLTVSAIVALAGVAAATLATSNIRSASTESDYRLAWTPMIGIEIVLSIANEHLAGDSGGFTSGGILDALDDGPSGLSNKFVIGTPPSGTVTVTLTDRHGAATDEVRDGVRITAKTEYDNTVRVESVWAKPDEGAPLAPLGVPVHVSRQLQVSAGAVMNVVGGPASCDGRTAVLGFGTINGDLESATSAIAGTVTGSVGVGDTPRGVFWRDAMEWYSDSAVTVSHAGAMNDDVLAPGVNSVGGGTSTEGIYFVDTGGADFRIENTRVYGTLVIDASAGGEVVIGERTRFEPAWSDRPTLIVMGRVVLQVGTNHLRETAVSFNPPGAPYNGITDNDTADTMPPGLFGLFQFIGTVSVENTVVCAGTMCVDGTLTIAADTTAVFGHDAALLDAPPRGYGETPDTSSLVIEAGSWRREAGD